MMKKTKWLSLLLAVVLALAMFMTGCGSSSGNNDQTGNNNQVGDNGDNENGNNGNNGNNGDNGGPGETPDGPGETPDGPGETPTEPGETPEEPGETPEEPVELTNTTVYFVGDSTVCSFTDQYYLPRYGYGTQFYNFVNSEYVTVNNLALSGRSSYSFTKESNYTTLVNNISAGDYLIIGFGHNDEKYEEERYANPNLSYTDTTTFAGRTASFQAILYNYYIKVAQDAGATPILCTPIVRLSTSDNYSGSDGHVTSGGTTTTGLTCPGGDYSAAIKTLGSAVGVDVVDLTALTKADYSALGYAAASNYHAFTSARWADADKTIKERVEDSVDKTHTNLFGAKMNAYYIATELVKLHNPLGNYVLSDITKPTYEADYAAGIKEDFPISDYQAFNPATDKSSLWNLTAEGWYGTAFGDIGGASKASTYTIRQNSENSFTVGNTANNGKIGSTEGIAAAFYQISANKNFTISATVTLDTYTGASQTGFGLMLRDDIYIDAYDSSIKSNYVAAGAYCTSSAANVIYSRVNTVLTPSGNTATFQQGSTHTLKIERDNQTVRVYFDDYYATYTDFDFVAIDNNYMYICLYATRGSIVTFSDVSLQITGDAVQA